jgi:chaperonin GroES
MKNESGILPTEYKILVKPKAAENKIGSIFIPDETKERNQFAQTEGELVAISPLAFTYANESEWSGAPKPKPGDRVLYAKYAGTTVKGKDGVDYRLVNDKDVAAVLA